ncbi:MAG: choice-of-anchor D domain-containing protein, partial [Spartobacteria bacterium]|nr:choice-of-anchor D domain-containing protein [Spartobacteria bacterium]
GGGAADRDWSTAANWTADTEAIPASNAIISAVSGCYTAEVTVAGERCASLFIGTSGDGALEQTGGDLVMSTNLVLGLGVGDSGTYYISDGDLVVSNDAMIGDSGAGVFTIEGIDADVVIGGNMQVSDSDANTDGAVYHNAGTVTVQNLYLGRLSGTDGLYMMTGGVLNVSDDIYLANGNANAIGRMILAGDAVVNAADEVYVGRNGLGILAVRDNAKLTLTSGSGHLEIADLSGNNNANEVQVDGGILVVGGDIKVGDTANSYGSLVLSNGAVTAGLDLYIANNATATGVVTMAGGGLGPDDIYVGQTGDGTFTLTGGSVTADQFEVGVSAGAVGEVVMSGGDIYINGTILNVGAAGTGRWALHGGTLRAGDGSGNTDVRIGTVAGGSGIFTHLGGTVLFTGPSSSDDSDLEIGGASSSGLYHLGGDGDLDISAGDDLLIHENGELKLEGSGWSASVDDDFVMVAGATLGVVFSNGMSTLLVDDDITVAGELNVSNYGSLVVGDYTVITSLNSSPVSGTFDTTNWLGGVTGTVSYADGAVVITFSGSIGVSCDDVDIPDASDPGQDFGSVGLVNDTVTKTFTITNSGLMELAVGEVVIGGTHSGDFTCTAQPSSPVAVGGTTTFEIEFDPSATGQRWANLSFTNNVLGDENPFNFSYFGTGKAAGISNSPSAISVSSTLGSAPAASGFGVTNIGMGDLVFTVSTNASWLTVSPVSGTLSEDAGQQHTITFAAAAGMQAGVSNATITITDANASNSPQTVSVEWTINAIGDPSVATATADGNTLVDLAWTKHASYDVMIVYRAGSASTAPSQGASYSVGAACGGGTVLYKGSGSALEHVVDSGVTHHYAFYSYTANNYYSAGLTDSDATGAFNANVAVETFSYTNETTLTGRHGSNLWAGAWYGDTGLFTNDAGSFTTQANYPANSGNKALTTPALDANVAVYRPLSREYKSGRMYFGYILNYQYSGSDKYAGLSFYWSNTAEKLFFGEIGTQDQQLGIDITGSSKTLTAGGGSDYIIIGYYDWGDAQAKAIAYEIGVDTVPTSEPGTWDVTVAKASNTVGWINTVRLAAGESGAGSGTPGECYFDELRIATNWNELLNLTATNPDDPGSGTATADGKEMVRLDWTKNGSSDSVLILHKTSAISTDPTDGTAYSLGDTIDGARVIYKGAATGLEHIVVPGSDNYYKFYSYNGFDYYSTGLSDDVSMESYATTENVNPFSYTNNTAFGATMRGGQGFGANYWAANSGTWTAQTNCPVAAADRPRFVNMTNYPAMAGNLAWVENPGDGASATADRDLAATINTGTLYVAYMMSYQYYGSNKWAGLSLMNGATEKAFFGKGGGGNWYTLAAMGDGTTYWSAYDLEPFAGGGGNTGNVYVIVGKYDFSSKLLSAKAWRALDYTFPETEPAEWDTSGTLGTGIDQITRIRLNVGSGSAGAGTIGRVFFDEIRYATNWAELLSTACPTWVGSNNLSDTWVYLGDSMNFECQTFPIGLGQNADIEIDFDQDNSWEASALSWMFNANNNSYWSNRVQMTSAGSITSRFAAAGSSCATIYSNNTAVTVSNIPSPTAASAVIDAVNTNSQINLSWTRSSKPHDVLILRRASDVGWPSPTQGQTYNAGDSVGDATVVYRGAATAFNDTGLAPSTHYYYRFFSENFSYYSVDYDADDDTTGSGSTVITVDGDPVDWVGSPGTVRNSGAFSISEYIWNDKRGEQRTDHADNANTDIEEFRIFADATDVYFLMTVADVTGADKPLVAIGVDTRRDAGSGAMNWLGDDSGVYIGSDYFGGGAAAAHYPEYNILVHQVGGNVEVELYAYDGTYWYGPPSGCDAAISAADDGIEVRIPRADIGLDGTVTGRFTVASLINSGSWANDGDASIQLVAGTPDAADSVSFAPYQENDGALGLSAWQEDISDSDIDFWVDVRFNGSGMAGNTVPSTPSIVSPPDDTATVANPTLIWNASTDSDGEVTGYFLEVSTNSQMNGVSGTENGSILLRVNLPVTQTNYTLSTSVTQYHWRVRARDTAGALSGGAINTFRIGGKSDIEGPEPTLLYIGTNVAGYLAGDYDTHISYYGHIQSITDAEVQQEVNQIGYVLRFSDPSGVYATNKMRSTDSPPGGANSFAWNIVSDDGRVSPNWDVFETNTVSGAVLDWGFDEVFWGSNVYAQGNTDLMITVFVHQAFTITNYNEDVEYYLTVSAEDGCTEAGSWWGYGSWDSFEAAASPGYYSGWCEDGPNTARNVTTNELIRINVTDDDNDPPTAARGAGWASTRALIISNDTVALSAAGVGQSVVYTCTDGDTVGQSLTFTFNAYDYYSGIQLSGDGPATTNTTFSTGAWVTNNYANYDAARSDVADTRSTNTILTWRWDSITYDDMSGLWGVGGPGDSGVTNPVMLTLWDIDRDRDNDQAVASNTVFGYLKIEDDDTGVPQTGET